MYERIYIGAHTYCDGDGYVLFKIPDTVGPWGERENERGEWERDE